MQMQMHRFESYTAKNTKEFTLSDACSPIVRVVGVHDGDTLTVVSELFPGAFFKKNVRVRGIDACEMRSKDDVLLQKAEIARDRVVQLVTGDSDFAARHTLSPSKTKQAIEERLERAVYHVTLIDIGIDKYGRVLACVQLPDGTSLSDTLLIEGLVYAYDGKARMTEAQQLSSSCDPDHQSTDIHV